MDLMYENYEMILFLGSSCDGAYGGADSGAACKSRDRKHPWYIEPSLQSGCDPLRGGCG